MATYSNNTTIKIQKKVFQYNTPGAGTHTVDIFSATDNSYIDVEYVKVIGNNSAIYRIIELTTGITLHTVSASSGGGGINVTMNRMAETTQDFMVFTYSGADTKPSHPKSLRIPCGCKLQATLTDVASRSNSVVAVGIEFINTP